MTAFALTEEQQAFAGRVRAIAADRLRPIVSAGSPGHVNRELIKAMGRLGLLPRLFPGAEGESLSREAAATDLCALGRTHLYDPAWTLHAAAEQGYAGQGAVWPDPFAAGSRRPQGGRTDGPRPRLELIRAGTPRTAHARWRPGAAS